jgi:Na+-translocating ferredoxin:NAD+ oxidoreductase RnfC subunit
MTLADQVRAAGVVGAGGGGFPTHVKLAAKADTVIANGAECEPLLHKDAVVMEQYPAELVRGMELAMDAVGAKHRCDRDQGQEPARPGDGRSGVRRHRVRVHRLGDYYPAGDEYDLVYGVTGGSFRQPGSRSRWGWWCAMSRRWSM